MSFTIRSIYLRENCQSNFEAISIWTRFLKKYDLLNSQSRRGLKSDPLSNSAFETPSTSIFRLPLWEIHEYLSMYLHKRVKYYFTDLEVNFSFLILKI